MWRLADRIARTVSDFTIGTVIVVAHVALASRGAQRGHRHMEPQPLTDGTRTWRSQISP